MRLFIIDNYDSFTYNIVQYFGELGAEQEVVYDATGIDDLKLEGFDGLVISPDRAIPTAGSAYRRSNAGPENSLLGVCLGHQSIGQAFGGKIIGATIMHGKTSKISLTTRMFLRICHRNFQPPVTTTRLSVIPCPTVSKSSLPPRIMRSWNPSPRAPGLGRTISSESLATENGITILKNFLDLPEHTVWYMESYEINALSYLVRRTEFWRRGPSGRFCSSPAGMSSMQPSLFHHRRSPTGGLRGEKDGRGKRIVPSWRYLRRAIAKRPIDAEQINALLSDTLRQLRMSSTMRCPAVRREGSCNGWPRNAIA